MVLINFVLLLNGGMNCSGFNVVQEYNCAKVGISLFRILFTNETCVSIRSGKVLNSLDGIGIYNLELYIYLSIKKYSVKDLRRRLLHLNHLRIEG